MEKKKILITGASGGIGGAIARRLARPGIQMILHGASNRKSLEDLAQEIEDKGATAEIWLKDFTKLNGESFSQEAILSHIDLFVHASGQALYKLIHETDIEEWDAIFNVHVKSAYLIMKKILPHMIRKSWGRILFISSIWGEHGAANETVYSSAKGALHALTKSLAKELAPSGITVNAIAPGAIDTIMNANLTAEELELLKEMIPVGRLGTPMEVGELAEFLLLGNCSYITGQIIHINGGWM